MVLADIHSQPSYKMSVREFYRRVGNMSKLV